MATRLVKDLEVHTGVTIADLEPSQEAAREWRAIAESAAETSTGSTPHNSRVPSPDFVSSLKTPGRWNAPQQNSQALRRF